MTENSRKEGTAAYRSRLERMVVEADDCRVPAEVDPRDVLELLAYVGRLENALHKIAAPKRPDGTYNLSREACEEIAREALRRGDT